MEALQVPTCIHGMRILIVGDAPGQATLRRWLEAWGARVDVVETLPTGVTCLRLAAQRGSSYGAAIWTDTLAITEGTRFVGSIRAEPGVQSSRFVLLATHDTAGTTTTARSLGFDACLVPPVTPAHLIAAVAGKQPVIAAPRAMPDVPPVSSTTQNTPALPNATAILIVEDNPINQQVALMQLHRLGYMAVAVENGQKAVEAIESGEYGLVFMDCQMPVMDGFEATRVIRSHPHLHRIPIIAMTANAQDEDRKRCLQVGMNDYLSKPLELPRLRSMVQRWMPTVAQADERERTPFPHRAAVEGRTGTHAQSRGESALLRRLRAADEPATESSALETLDPQRIQRLRALTTPDDPGFVQRLFEGFLRDTPAIFEALRVAIQANDAEAVRQLAHTCKGSSANFGAQRLGALCLELERMGQTRMLAGAERCLRQLEAEWAAVQAAVHREQHHHAV